MTVRRAAVLTAGGFAPCLSSAVAGLIERYSELAPDVELLAYRYGFQGLLTGSTMPVTAAVRSKAGLLHGFGGSPLGNSRVRFTNLDDVVRRGLVEEGQDPFRVAADRLVADEVDVLHTIGGDDTSTTAADLSRYLGANGYDLTVVGLPKTIDNDIVPVRQSLGAWSAADEGARFARNVVSEHNSGYRMLIVHEIMGRHCGWLTAATSAAYRRWLDRQEWLPEFGVDRAGWDIHAVYLPEIAVDVGAEAERLAAVMDRVGNVNIFLSEGAAGQTIHADLRAAGKELPRDPFGHVELAAFNTGSWFVDRLAGPLGARKTMVQKSGYFSRSGPANARDLRLIKSMTDYAVDCGLQGRSGLVGHDEGHDGRLRAIEFHRVRGGRAFDPDTDWFRALLQDIGQPFSSAA